MSGVARQSDYPALLSEIKERIRAAQYEALKAVNKELIALYWDIGHTIMERQQGQSWGKSVVERLAKDLQAEFPGIQGFSARNIWRMRDFYLTYRNNEKLTPMVAEIGWTHNLLVLSPFPPEKDRVTAATAAERNRFVAALADALLVTHATPGGKTESLAREALGWGKAVYTLADPANTALIARGARPLPAHAARAWATTFTQPL